MRIAHARFLLHVLGDTPLTCLPEMAANATFDNEYDFVKKPSADYFCPVTLELLTDPHQTNSCCGKHLSRVVAEQLEAEGKPCPLCKKAPLKTTADLFFKRKVMELKVRCSNKSAGCEWKGEVGTLDNHLQIGAVEGNCAFVDVQCPLECGKRIQRRELHDHKTNECVKRPFTCKYCYYKATYQRVVDDHWPICQCYPEVCPSKCSNEAIERRFLKSHLEEKCSLQKIKCKFSHAGCKGEMVRQKMQDHLEEEKDKHLALVSAKCETLEDKLIALEYAFTQIAPKPVFIPPPEIIMNNFDKLKTGDQIWYTAPFYTHVGGYKMCLRIDANGQGSGKGTNISVFVFMMKGEFDSHLQWPFKGEVTVQLVNQREGGENYEMKHYQHEKYDEAFKRVTEGDKATKGLGYPKFISHDVLYNPEDGKEYLKNDTLKFKIVEIVVNSV